MQIATLFVAIFLSICQADPVPDCPPEGHAINYAYQAPQVQLSVDKYESFSVAPEITYAKSAGVLLAEKSPSASYASILPSGEKF